MKKLLSITLCLTLLLACSKEKEVTFDHPVKADVEIGLESVSLACEWLAADSGNALEARIGSSDAGLLMCVVPDSFEGGAAAWFSSKLPSWANSENSVGLAANGKYLFVMADPSVTVSTFDNTVSAERGEFRIYLGALSESDIPALLSQTWYEAETSRVIYALELGGRSLGLEQATFVDCLSAQLGAAVRSRFLYTSAGTWNCLSSIRESSDRISFTINAEEGKL